MSADYDVEMATDGDDSFWYNVSVWDNRFGNENNLCRNRSGDVAVVYMRWQVNVPKDATINSANFSIYVWSENDQSHTVRRIIEANVSPDMESRGDFEFPNITLTNEVGFTADTASQYELINITDMMQDQVDLSGWASGQYFGVGIVGSQTAPTEFRDREANDYNAYLNISYTEGAGEDPIEDPPEQDYDYTIQEFVAADSDDTTWKLTLPSTWSDNDSLTEVVTTNSSGSFYRYGLMRFQLDIPAGCTVNYATVSMYLINNGNESVTIQRIDEVNVGDLEADTSKPDSTSLHSGSFFGGPATGWVTSGNIAEMIQDAIDTDGWATNNYFGVEMSISSPESSSSVGWNDYQLGSNPAYLNVTYTNTTVGWLSGWQYRKKYVSDQMNGGDVNRTIPVFLYEGTGSDGGYIGRLNDNANNDFSDVRFTSDNGTLLIKYYHNQTVTGTSEDHFMEDGVGFPWGATNTPAAYYDSDTDRTYVAFQGDLAPAGDDLDPHICYYDHQTASWSGIYWIAENPLNEWQGGDSHGAPSLWIDNNGYIHVLFGAHASQVIQHVVSDNPNDITSFSAATDPTTGTWEPTYPAVHYDSTNDVVHLFYRGSTGGRYLVYQNSTDNGDTWNSEQAIVYMGTTQGMHNRPYHGFNAFSDNEIIHIAFQNHSMWPSAGSGGDRDMFYIQFNVTNGRVYNITGSDFGTQASPTEIQDARFYEYPLENGTRSGYPDVFLDDDGNPWIFYYVGDTQLEYNNDYTELQGNPSDFTLRYSYWNSTSSAWQSANITAATSHEGSGPCAAALVWTDSNITIWSNTDKTTNLVHRWTWDGSSWTHQGSISVTASYLVSNPIVPTNYADGNRTEFQVAFNEFEGANPPFEKCMGWAWGSGGLLSRTEQDLAKFNVMIVGNFTTSAQTIYVYYGRSDATSKSGTFSLSGPPDPSPLWWGPQTENVDYFDFVDQVSNEDGVADIGTHSNFANQQAGPDAVYDTLSEVDVSTGGYYETDYFDGWASNIDGIADIGTDSSQSNAQAGPDSSYMNVQEGNEGGGTTTTEYIAEAFTDVGGDFGSESNAYDGDWGTYATDTIFSNADDYPSAYASGFDSGASGSGTITQVDIVIRMSFSSSSASDSWGITLDVSASTNNELRAHDDQPYSLNNLTFTDVTEPNGGGW
ncbi:MAG: BNR-4 repeat-containing protein, partial [Planctomycetota bacterium]